MISPITQAFGQSSPDYMRPVQTWPIIYTQTLYTENGTNSSTVYVTLSRPRHRRIGGNNERKSVTDCAVLLPKMVIVSNILWPFAVLFRKYAFLPRKIFTSGPGWSWSPKRCSVVRDILPVLSPVVLAFPFASLSLFLVMPPAPNMPPIIVMYLIISFALSVISLFKKQFCSCLYSHVFAQFHISNCSSLCDAVMLWNCDVVILWCFDVVMWYCDTVILGYCEIVMLWYCDGVILWCCDAAMLQMMWCCGCCRGWEMH